MFWKKRKKEKVKYDVASENLAVPEVHTGEVEHTETDPQPDEPITDAKSANKSFQFKFS